MISLTELHDAAERNNIDIIDYSISNSKKAVCLYKRNQFKTIALNRAQIESTAEEKVLLFEELSHFETENLYFIDATSNMGTGKLNKIIYESRTRRYSIKKYLPLKKLKQAYEDGCRNAYEVAEYLNVTEDFIRQATEYYTEIYKQKSEN
jgi:Domain of unknown function (DUF955).